MLNVKNNNSNNKQAPRVAKAAPAALKQKKDQKKKRFDPPCQYCVSKGIPDPKRPSHQEHDCKFKNGEYTWRDRHPAQTAQAPPQTTQTPPQAAGRVSPTPSTQQEENASNPQEDPQPTEEQRENAVREHFGYLHYNLPAKISGESNNSNRLDEPVETRISVSAIRHDTRRRREEQINKLRTQSKDKDDKQSRLAT